jgi:hypothetical protein
MLFKRIYVYLLEAKHTPFRRFSITGLTGAFNATMQAELAKGPVVASANSTSSSAPGVASGRTMNSTSTILKSNTSGAYKATHVAPFVTLLGLGAMLVMLTPL